MNQQIEPGYRTLDDGEIIVAGDEYLDGQRWCRVDASVGMSVYESKACHGWAGFRRRISVDPGYGYRLLSGYEFLATGDEHFDSDGMGWCPTARAGELVQRRDHKLIYRRRIFPEYGYSILNEDSVLCAGDQYYTGSHWLPVFNLIGQIVRTAHLYFGWRAFRRATIAVCAPFETCRECKPPLGLTPRSIWLEKSHADDEEFSRRRHAAAEARHDEVVAAIRRYVESKRDVPAEWVDEYFHYLNTR